MAIQIGAKPSPTFAQPLELLSDCHRRVESFLAALLIVAEQAQGRALDTRQREALEVSLRYFREAAPKHTADEEESLFPRIRELGEAAHDVMQKIEALEADHIAAKRSHDLVEQLGQRWLCSGTLSTDETREFTAALRDLRATYERHIAIEDNEVFPLAARIVPADKLAEVGREMAERRGQPVHRSIG
jgi:hemerythrin-like domain-containing protein